MSQGGQSQPDAKGVVTADHYGVLGLNSNASKGEVRARFLKLVRLYHPDKSNSIVPSLKRPQAGDAAPRRHDVMIHDIYAAHQILTDDAARRAYDESRSRKIAADRAGAVDSGPATKTSKSRISATVDLDAFVPCSTSGGDSGDRDYFTLPCRCGAEFIVTSEELLEQNVELVECQGCSEVIRVVWQDEDDRQSDADTQPP